MKRDCKNRVYRPVCFISDSLPFFGRHGRPGAEGKSPDVYELWNRGDCSREGSCATWVCAHVRKWAAHKRTNELTTMPPPNIITPLRPEVFARYLASHPNGQFVYRIVSTTLSGADIGCQGSQESTSTSNFVGARIDSNFSRQQISKEMQQNYSCSPFSKPPLPYFITSALGVCSKQNGYFGVILDLSRPCGKSVNDSFNISQFPTEALQHGWRRSFAPQNR